MTRRPRFRSLLLLGCVVSGAASAAHINSDYRVDGDPQALPVQAFDDGKSLYLQLNNPAEPPAPLGVGGPLTYKIRGPYMVLPLEKAVILRYGPYQARVLADGASGFSADEGGVASITTPVVAEPTEPKFPQRLAPVEVAPSGGESLPSHRPGGLGGKGGVAGTITVTGPDGRQLAPPARKPPQPKWYEVSYTHTGDRVSFEEGSHYRLVGDDTTAGAQAVLGAQSMCVRMKATCSVVYRGATTGKMKIEEIL